MKQEAYLFSPGMRGLLGKGTSGGDHSACSMSLSAMSMSSSVGDEIPNNRTK